MRQAIYVSDDQKIVVNGALNFHTVPQLRELGDRLLTTQEQIIFDLEGVSKSDSSALALLTAWSRRAKQLGKIAYFIHLPPQLLDLAKLSNLDGVLKLS